MRVSLFTNFIFEITFFKTPNMPISAVSEYSDDECFRNRSSMVEAIPFFCNAFDKAPKLVKNIKYSFRKV